MPRTIEKEIYTAKELQEKDPRAFERARQEYADRMWEDAYWQDEMMESLTGLVESAGLNLDDWRIGAYSQGCFIKVTGFNGGGWMDAGADELRGARALAWIENNILADLRIPFEPLSKKEGKRRELARYGAYYRAGMVKPGPFTGACYDEDVLGKLRENVLSGFTLKESFEQLAADIRRMIEEEGEYVVSEESFIESADANEYEFYENGEMV